MLRSFRYFGFTTLACLLLFNCAKRGSITGGPKDETPPELLRATPPNKSTNFKKKEIQLTFDELVTIEKPDEQILISPPMKNKPEIKPLGFASKTIKIKLLDTLLPNTTYTINFGNSVVDYNEKNPFSFFQYVFSTGNVLDSLSFRGEVRDAFKQKLQPNTSVFLYEENETSTDSIIYNTLPRYVSSTLDSTTFQFNNLKAGKYRLIALQDKNKNYKFDPKIDQIGFIENTISIPEDSIANLSVFKEIPDFKYVRAKQLSKNHFQVGFSGTLEEPSIAVLGDFPDSLQFKTRLFKHPKKDTLDYWVKPFVAQDSIIFKAINGKEIDTIISRYKDQHKDSLKINVTPQSILKLKEAILISANTPLEKLDEKLISILDKDTLPVAFTVKKNNLENEYRIDFSSYEDSNYRVELLPNAVEDFLGNTLKDTIVFNFRTLENSAYGTLKVTIANKNDANLIVQLVQAKEVKSSKAIGATGQANFLGITPGKYSIKIIEDTNNNGKWDTGNYLNKIQPERIFYFEKQVDIRANWDVKQEVSLP